MKPAQFTQADIDKERAYGDCRKHGTPTMGVDHGSHYKPIAGADMTGRKTLAEYEAETNEAFGIKEKDND